MFISQLKARTIIISITVADVTNTITISVSLVRVRDSGTVVTGIALHVTASDSCRRRLASAAGLDIAVTGDTRCCVATATT